MEDNLRNRLQMFIGKFSDAFIHARKNNQPDPPASQLLSDQSLIKWDNKNNETIIGKARKLIWVAHNSTQLGNHGAKELLDSFDQHHAGIKMAEDALYSFPDRHISSKSAEVLEAALHSVIEAFLHRIRRWE